MDPMVQYTPSISTLADGDYPIGDIFLCGLVFCTLLPPTVHVGWALAKVFLNFPYYLPL